MSLRCARLLQIRGVRNFSTAPDKLVNVSSNEKTGIATVSMQRLPVNGLNLELLQALGKTFDDLEKNKCKGMILTSESPTVFSAGLDIMEMYKPNPERCRNFWSTLQDTWIKLYTSSFPTVAAINGHSPAGGCLLALSCEYRVMVGPKNTIGLNETKLGIIAPKWFQDCMKNVIGVRKTELALTQGKLFSTAEALAVGLIDEVASDKADAISRAEKFIGIFSSIPGLPRRMSKMGLRQETVDWLLANRDKDLKAFVDYVSQPKVQQGLELYLQSLKKK